METYLKLFEDVLRAEARELGPETAYHQARNAGLDVSGDGRILGFDEDPQLVLLRLIKHFTDAGSMPALMACTPLINEILRRYDIRGVGAAVKNSAGRSIGSTTEGGSSSDGA